MRQELKKLQEQRKTFVGDFKRYGSKTNWHGFPEKTILLINIRGSGREIFADHIWFKLTKGFENIGELEEGDTIQFDARVKKYVKGWHGRKAEEYGEERYETDYKLNFPTKISRLKSKK
jgi:hypothetical protein